MSRPHEDGIGIGTLEPGPRNSIADVGVTVGHVTVERTGVTAVVPPSLPVPAGTAVLNGAGELTGSLEIRGWGILETPVYLTSTHAVGRVYDGAVSVAVAVADATVDFEQGAVGASAAMSCFVSKGGIGSSSRRSGDHTVGVLLLT